MKPQNKANFQRILNATSYSMNGLKNAYINEAAFRQEVWLSFFLIPIGLVIGNGATEKILLCASVLIILIIELLNSAIENVVDRIGTEYHELSGRAKDLGSAAVFIAFIQLIITWCLILFS